MSSSYDKNSDYHEVLCEEMPGVGGDLGIITLNRPEVLNSLNHTMIQAIYTQLTAWTTADHIKAVVIRAAAGRAFCAGGDLRFVYHSDYKTNLALFYVEYQLNSLIFHYPKPYIALLDGITMGGGAGISIYGSHRVATDKLIFAMPETCIGFFPDIGGSYFLPRLPGKLGYYLGLLGVRVNADDCLALGIATHKVTSEVLPEIIEALAAEDFQGDSRAAVMQLLTTFALANTPSKLIEQQAAINECFAGANIEAIVQSLQQSSNGFCMDAGDAMYKKSPTSLKVTLRALQYGEKLNFDACLEQERRLVQHFLQGHDFIEGIRAALIDKDQTPHWLPGRLEEVTEKMVESYFI
ncbi:MAG TPA: enoyl-CoA hydratase/isomerase family protein [Gammaproteobacteria bacterium]|jgi:enoyl-CoA hydratase/carnithine racemase|nr:enoyl-CoA hydratase/isomerase family protein [Gammaproteobacteria bacterium]